ncbi:hypothetical protein Rhopal_001943-T1 [Rhodotorula paludigena]|uniref:GATA-type domain-containing protein n=1 Tax=Rhodotorula paludigena TaxID=86838 RepID=A0AAV5GIS6_9BASI|nr:hypothetical protein Rhopal_001943-T1 [Rhodotorula paludigena]
MHVLPLDPTALDPRTAAMAGPLADTSLRYLDSINAVSSASSWPADVCTVKVYGAPLRAVRCDYCVQDASYWQASQGNVDLCLSCVVGRRYKSAKNYQFTVAEPVVISCIYTLEELSIMRRNAKNLHNLAKLHPLLDIYPPLSLPRASASFVTGASSQTNPDLLARFCPPLLTVSNHLQTHVAPPAATNMA